MSNILYVIDGYLSSSEKVDVTIELIEQLRKLDSNRKVMLINKFPNSWGIENLVDYYREYPDGFSVGYPPQEFIDLELYDKPYVFFETQNIILENWMPLVGVSDHVANVYNGFIYAMQEAKNIGFTKIFRIEYDMLFDDEEFKTILKDINKFENEDYLIYGRRKEGVWAQKKQSLIDLHFCGYSEKLVEGFEIVKNDDEFWNLCRKIGYVGKWAEYVLSMVFESNINNGLVGNISEIFTRKIFTKSQFDRISSSGEWTDKWKYIPKICRVDVNNGHQEDTTKVGIFYLNMDYDVAEIETISNKDYHKKITLTKGAWCWDILERRDEMVFMTNMICDGVESNWVEYLTEETYDKLNCRMVLK
jgi:hypothetical protein